MEEVPENAIAELANELMVVFGQPQEGPREEIDDEERHARRQERRYWEQRHRHLAMRRRRQQQQQQVARMNVQIQLMIPRRQRHHNHHQVQQHEDFFEWQEQLEQDRLARVRERQEVLEWRQRSLLRRGQASLQQEYAIFPTARLELPKPSILQGKSAHEGLMQQAHNAGVEVVMVAPEFNTQQFFLKRVTACIGWAVHGLVFEFMDNSRVGCILDGFAEKYLDLTDDNIRRRLGVDWQDVDYGDYIVGMHGSRLHNTSLLWMCQTVVLEFRSGKTIRFEATHEPWRGEDFSYTLPRDMPCLVYRATFRHEQQEDMRGVMTSIHLSLSAANMKYLPAANKRTVEQILVELRQIDTNREAHGHKALNDDLWWNILGWIRAWEMPIVPDNAVADGLVLAMQRLRAS